MDPNNYNPEIYISIEFLYSSKNESDIHSDWIKHCGFRIHSTLNEREFYHSTVISWLTLVTEAPILFTSYLIFISWKEKFSEVFYN